MRYLYATAIVSMVGSVFVIQALRWLFQRRELRAMRRGWGR